jgi:hypothetical protein
MLLLSAVVGQLQSRLLHIACVSWLQAAMRWKQTAYKNMKAAEFALSMSASSAVLIALL